MATYSVYNLGEKGVQLVKSPIHMEGGELERAQNCILDTDQREGSLRKRPGLVKLNASALAGSVRGLVAVPLSDPDTLTTTFWAPIDAASGNTWQTSTNGTTWTGSTAIARAARVDQMTWTAVNEELFPTRIVDASDTLIYYPADDTWSGAQPILRATDGTFDAAVFTLPVTVASVVDRHISATRFIDPYIYFATWASDGGNSKWRVYQLNPGTGQVKAVGDVVSETGVVAITDLVEFNGRLWSLQARTGVSGYGAKSILPPTATYTGESSWTAEFTLTNLVPISAVVYEGNLYIGTSNSPAPGSTTPKVIQVTASSATSTSDEGATSTGTSLYGSLIVYEGDLYAARFQDATPDTLVVRKFDGTTWTTDQNVLSLHSTAEFIGQAVVTLGNLYYVFPSTTAANGAILKNAGGTWSLVDSGVAYRGPISSLQAD